jgi:hypothetical protein
MDKTKYTFQCSGGRVGEEAYIYSITSIIQANDRLPLAGY